MNFFLIWSFKLNFRIIKNWSDLNKFVILKKLISIWLHLKRNQSKAAAIWWLINLLVASESFILSKQNFFDLIIKKPILFPEIRVAQDKRKKASKAKLVKWTLFTIYANVTFLSAQIKFSEYFLLPTFWNKCWSNYYY